MYDVLILVLTWIKTAGVRKSCSELGVQTSLTALLLRDGKYISFHQADYLNYHLVRYHLLLVGRIVASMTQG